MTCFLDGYFHLTGIGGRPLSRYPRQLLARTSAFRPDSGHRHDVYSDHADHRWRFESVTHLGFCLGRGT